VLVLILKAWLFAGWGGPPDPVAEGCPDPGSLGLIGLVAGLVVLPGGLWIVGALGLAIDCC
jgi:hypothetical protein